MRLSREIRSRIMAGECPFIGGEGIAPIKAGHTWKLSAYVTVTVDRIDHKRGKWMARYTVTDRRDLRKSADRYLRRTPGPPNFEELRETFDEHGYPAAVADGESDDAAVESAYTNRADLAIDLAPVVPPEYQAKLAKDAEAKNAAARQTKLAEAQRAVADLASAARGRKAKSRIRRIKHDLMALSDEDAA